MKEGKPVKYSEKQLNHIDARFLFFYKIWTGTPCTPWIQVKRKTGCRS
jgi:hypothetical protein